MWCLRPPVHAQHVEERAETQRRACGGAATQRRRGANTAPTEVNSLGKMDSLDDDGEKNDKSKANCRQEKSKANCRQEKSIANSRQRHM